MSAEQLKENFKRLMLESSKLMEANDEVEEAYITVCEAGLEAQSEQQRADIEKTAIECEQRSKQIKDLIKETLWSKFGGAELSLAVQVAESECECVSSVKPDASVEAYEFMLHLESLVKAAKEAHSRWSQWAPPAEQENFGCRVRELEICLPKLVSRKTTWIQARLNEDAGGKLAPIHSSTPVPAIRLKPTALPKFTGNKRDFYRWKREWNALQRQGEPTGSQEVRKFQLLDSLDDKVSRDLCLPTYSTADEVFRVLENCFGNQTAIALETVEELQAMPPVRGHQPRKIVELIRAVEKALYDLNELGNVDTVKNPLVTKSIESKLPESLKKEWLVYAAEDGKAVQHQNRFDKLLTFLRGQESIYEQLDQLKDEEPSRKETRFQQKHARTRTAKASSEPANCIICGDNKHRTKLYFCRKFKTNLRPSERRNAVMQLGACSRCLEIHGEDGYCKTSFLCKNSECKDQHHYYLCPLTESKNWQRSVKPGAVGGGSRRYTGAQEEFLSKLSPELARQCRDAFSNAVSKSYNSTVSEYGLLGEYGLQELPVIMMLLNITANAGQKIGTLIDLASDTNYITHKAADKLNLQREDVTLVVHGVGGMKVLVETKRYLLKIRVNTPRGTLKAHQLVCYGLHSIAEIHKHVGAKKLQKIFPDVPLHELKRPTEIQLLISHKEGRLVPQKVRSIGDLVLWDGPLGKTVGGTHPDLFEEAIVTAHSSKTHFARSMRTAGVKYKELSCKDLSLAKTPFIHADTAAANTDFLKWWKWDSIGAACEPRCGGCRCGNCQPGGKEMSLAEERELEMVRNGLRYVTGDDHCERPHWHAKYPWAEDPTSLPNNRKAVEATFLRTEKQLKKEPEWKAAYASQVHDMVQRKAAVKLSEEELQSWTGSVWYISHLIAPNPHSVSTPIRLVWNSSQKFRGLSLNDLLIKGPDVLNPIRAVLLRLRAGVFAALGDIRKMYNSVWLEDEEVHLHRFLWRESENDQIEDFAITRVNIGDKPAGCIAQLAMRETANLPQFSHLKEERRVLHQDAYVDDILTSHNTLDQLKRITSNVEQILVAGGFYMKPWVYSNECETKVPKCGETETKTIVLPNQLTEDDNKALGLGYTLDDDQLHVMVAVNFSRKKKKLRLGQNLLKEEVRMQAPRPLTRRELLSQVAGLYDPLGLVAPVKQKGVILVRRAFQEARAKYCSVKDTWDAALSDKLRENAIKLLEEYVELGNIRFTRSLTPPDPNGKPCGITFSDGSEDAYGAVLYLRWDCNHDVAVRLVEAKAKLTPLDQKGDAVKAEMCGAVFAARLKSYFERHCRIQVEKWYHLVDSQTVLGAIQRESYGYQTFFANRVGEIQNSTNVQDWWWIPGALNVADLITRGASPKDLTKDSEWQTGPKFLSLPENEWPKRSSKDVAAAARENIVKIQKKSFVAVLNRINQKGDPEQSQHSVQKMSSRPPTGLAVQMLIDVRHFSNLTRLVKTVAWTWRAAKRFLRTKARDKSKWEAVSACGIITVVERQDAFRDLCLAAQAQVTFPSTTTDRLVVYRDMTSGLLVCGGRIQYFKKDGKAVPLLPFDAWIATLWAHEAHSEGHEGVAGTLLRMRRKAWVIRGSRIAQKVVDKCIVCKKARARTCQQVMGDLPEERTRPAAPFEFTAVDLFGPYQVRDDIKKRVTMKVWGVVFCCMSSRAIHAELANTLSTESFLLAYQRFTALRGHPLKVWSDPGTNFVGARPVLAELYAFLGDQNKETLEEFAVKHGTEWTWKINPADSPHRNGAAEAAVRIMKRALQSLGKGTNLSFSEFLTVLQLAANLANERPIDARAQSLEDRLEYITPNSLLLGRALQSGDIKTFDFGTYPYKRLREIQAQVNHFWKSWSQLAGPNLFVRCKWHTTERNVAVGDIVWLCDQNALRGQFKLGRVICVNPDSKGTVRDVKVQVSPSHCVPISGSRPTAKGSASSDRGSTVLHRDVRRLVVLLPVEDQDN
ncbi:hypothetical protein D9C73_028022 [Collichthys lucidus]|uniref:Integrase catalytic domain-containing protein n=1 Tax=Collichthys lucidus TaxID=240159 RepID=A0A4U5TVU6_COLLU|nr:hypothetical protein D9C73_028022 [Collichthys lucidus]